MSWKSSYRGSITNKKSIYGDMGGLAKGRTAGASGNRATNKLVIPRGAAAGLAYMQLHGILSRNPQTGGVGKVVKSKPCNCKGLGKTKEEGVEEEVGSLTCPPGTMWTFDTAQKCIPCEDNFWCPGGVGAGAAGPCAAGTSNSSVSMPASESSCTKCPAGQYSIGGGYASGNCTQCAAGRFSAVVGATAAATCTECHKGTWSAAGAASCSTWTPCNAGQEPSGGSATQEPACIDCSWGTYSKAGEKCLDCSGIPLGPGTSAYARDSAVGCSTTADFCFGKSRVKSTDGGSEGHFCCVSGTDGLYSLDASSGKCDPGGSICRLEGTGDSAHCDVSGCHEALKTAAEGKTAADGGEEEI